MMNRGFTLIELIVVIAIIAVLSGIILFSVTLYINKGKDSNISGNLVVLIPAGEVYYNGNGNSYHNDNGNFCDPAQDSVIKNAISQMPQNINGSCYGGNPADPATWMPTSNPAGVCCYAESQAWAACATRFLDPTSAYCVDSHGVKKEICSSQCGPTITSCPDATEPCGS